MFTRKQYLNGEVSHDEYYQQFVTKETIININRDIGKTRLLNCSGDLNKIPLYHWDMATLAYDKDLFLAQLVSKSQQ